ncbi:mating type 1-1 [Lecanosticta acicola]|uniref:Mating-type protein MAT-1 n=1 Tax=Lecanosticta acicola TaxID=111012 RepID=A0AAI8YRK8_9PEZI|nr:mating type 1-1 [Lecanosticta acicola]
MATDAMTDEFRAYLERCSDEMASQIISVLLHAGRHSASSATPDMTATGSAVAKAGRRQRTQARPAVAAGGPKRPLNSWMAFRKYYNAMLAPHTQKAISKALTIFWREDPFEAKWAILAKAYSIVRGCREKKDAPLDDFFAICAPLISVIPPEVYLGWMGWQLGPPPEGEQEKVLQITRAFTPNLDSFPEEYTTTTLSVDDLVNHCYAMGYGNASNNDSPNTSTQGSLTMVSKPTAITTDDKDETAHMAPFAQTNTTPAFTVAAPAAGQATLEQVTEAMEMAGAGLTYNNVFDPTSEGAAFGPAVPDNTVEDGGRYESWPADQAAEADLLLAQNELGAPLNWDQWVNENFM